MLQAPAAPRHELMVQEDGRDWALEQMAQAAAPATAASAGPSARRCPFSEDISAGEGVVHMHAPLAAALAPLRAEHAQDASSFTANTVDGSSRACKASRSLFGGRA